jgi:hypothetical protein
MKNANWALREQLRLLPNIGGIARPNPAPLTTKLASLLFSAPWSVEGSISRENSRDFNAGVVFLQQISTIFAPTRFTEFFVAS